MGLASDTFRNESSDFSHWRDAVCDAVVDLDCAKPSNSPFHGTILSLPMRDLRMIKVAATPHQVTRDRQRASKATEEFVLLSQVVSGSSTLVQGGREARLQAGDFAIYDTTTPYQMVLDRPFEMNVVRIERSRFARHVSDISNLTALAVSGRRGTGRIASMLIEETLSQFEDIGDHGARQLNTTMLALIAAALTEAAGERPVDRMSEPRHLLVQRVIRLVEDELGNEELNCDYIARRLGISDRYLRKLFSERGASLSDMIWDRRLIEAQRQLGQVVTVQKSVTTIAYECGFKDSAHFSRAFRSRFGMSPREFRNQRIKG
ncbi:helix-turn-helix domain-containing protein [Novosphingobium sp. SG707]|uniref:helix-turn-helix domain-containing protein n=1 Tax=Novosphingobium sp. SG707 TaxID=2586996 RepID=UPI0014481592|nr:helix-turn-helix domain-containing protein [Novosphingobium sp. SG707]NKJ01645.1 AraC-like DNA-binding protein [Novosphingobium sp. SG707]